MPRRTKKKTYRRKFTGVNVMNVAEAYALTNIWTQAAFRTNPIEFVTGFTRGTYNPGTDGANIVSLPELLGAGPGGFGGRYGNTVGVNDNLQNVVMTNFGGWEGLAMAGLKTAAVSAGFKVAKKLTRRPRSMLNRQVLKPLGMGDFIKV